MLAMGALLSGHLKKRAFTTTSFVHCSTGQLSPLSCSEASVRTYPESRRVEECQFVGIMNGVAAVHHMVHVTVRDKLIGRPK